MYAYCRYAIKKEEGKDLEGGKRKTRKTKMTPMATVCLATRSQSVKKNVRLELEQKTVRYNNIPMADKTRETVVAVVQAHFLLYVPLQMS